MQLISN